MNKKTERVLRKMAGNGYPEIKEALTEIERLRGELGIWKSVFPDLAPNEVQPDRSSLLQEIERLRTEEVSLTQRVGRLRLALEAIAHKGGETNAHGYALQQIAREALDSD
jgi:hypothetical protein